MNTSQFSDEQTANTKSEIAQQRAINLSKFKIKTVLELCVGPSLKSLKDEYSKFGITTIGNDIDIRWKSHYPDGIWIIGNCLDLNLDEYDAVVFGPPLTKNCSGKREDSLSINEINPSYYDFLKKWERNNVAVLVLPARSMKTKEDRKQFFKLTAFLEKQKFKFKIKELRSNKRDLVKYIDIYLQKEEKKTDRKTL